MVATTTPAAEFSGSDGPAKLGVNVMPVGGKFGSFTTPEMVTADCRPLDVVAIAFNVISEYVGKPIAVTVVLYGAVVTVANSVDENVSSLKNDTCEMAGPLTYVNVIVNVFMLSITNGGETAGDSDSVTTGPVLSILITLLLSTVRPVDICTTDTLKM